MYRQGDVLLIPTHAEIPKEFSQAPTQKGRVILAEGEATGHAHAISSENADLYEPKPGNKNADHSYLRVVETEVDLVHEEHAPINVKPGIYLVVKQREYEPESRESRNVLD